MPSLVTFEEMRILDFDHRRTRAARHYHRLFAREDIDRVPSLCTGQIGVPAIKHRLAAAGLSFGKIDLMAEATKHPDHRLPRARTHTIAQAGDHQGELHRLRETVFNSPRLYASMRSSISAI